MFSWLTPYKTMIEIAVFVAALAFVSIEIHRFMDHQQDIGYQRAVAEFDAKQKIADKAAADRTELLRQQLEAAQNAASDREKNLQAILDTSGAMSNSLRDALANIRSGVPSATIDTLRRSTDTLATVLTDCQSGYRDMAAKADRHASDVKTLMDAWPKSDGR